MPWRINSALGKSFQHVLKREGSMHKTQAKFESHSTTEAVCGPE